MTANLMEPHTHSHTHAHEAEFGHYELLAKIGEGPRGPIFVARSRVARGTPAPGDVFHAIELSTFATAEDEAQHEFVRDIESAARIQHRNVLGIVELGANSAGRYAVSPYFEGCRLSEIQERSRELRPPRLVVSTVIDALHGLHAAHSVRLAGVITPLVHGSLSPGQLLIGVDGTTRVAGFGHARPRRQTKPSQRRIATGYLAPEQLNGEAVDHRADLFSIGVVLWNALTGKRLFHDPIEHETMANVLSRKIPRPSLIGLSPPPALDAFVMKALERNPERRFQDAAEMAGALRDLARGAGCLASSAELAEWVMATFGDDLIARRRAIRELATRPGSRTSDTAVLPRLVPPTESSARDYLSLDELARANELRQRAPSRSVSGEVTAVDYPDAPSRKQLALVAAAAFAVVGCVLGWRWSVASAQAEPAEVSEVTTAVPRRLAVTVLDVRPVALPAAAAPARPVEPEPAAASQPARTVEPAAAPASATVEPARAAPAPSATAPTRSPPRRKIARPQPARPAEIRTEPEVKPPEPDPAPPRPEPAPRPTLESNPYIYNK